MGGIRGKALHLGFTALAAIGLIASAYMTGRSAGVAYCEVKWADQIGADKDRARADERRAQALADAIGQRITEEIGRIRIEHKTVREVIRDEVREVPVYSECHISQRLLDTLNTHRAATDPGALP